MTCQLFASMCFITERTASRLGAFRTRIGAFLTRTGAWRTRTGAWGTRIGAWWDRKGENELDIVAENELTGDHAVCEVKRKGERIDLAAVV